MLAYFFRVWILKYLLIALGIDSVVLFIHLILMFSDRALVGRSSCSWWPLAYFIITCYGFPLPCSHHFVVLILDAFSNWCWFYFGIWLASFYKLFYNQCLRTLWILSVLLWTRSSPWGDAPFSLLVRSWCFRKRCPWLTLALFCLHVDRSCNLFGLHCKRIGIEILTFLVRSECIAASSWDPP